MLDANWLRNTRIGLGLTMEDVAKEMHCTKQTISNIESGKFRSNKGNMGIAFYERILLDHLNKISLSSWDI